MSSIKPAPVANGFITPNEVIDEYMAVMPPVAFKCYLFVLRKTVGWNKPDDKISLSQFEAATGNKKGTVSEAVNWLEKAGFILREITKGQITTYSLNREKGATISIPEKRIHSKGCPPRRTAKVSAEAEGVSAEAEGVSAEAEGVSAEAEQGVRRGGTTNNTITNNTITNNTITTNTKENVGLTPAQMFTDPDKHPEFKVVAEAWQLNGNGRVKPRDLSLYVKHVADKNLQTQFLLGAQNYLNQKSEQNGARYMNLDTFINEESWTMDKAVKPGAIRVPGAPTPLDKHQAAGKSLAEYYENQKGKTYEA